MAEITKVFPYHYAEVEDLSLTNRHPIFEQVVELDITDLPSGVYAVTVSLVWNLPSTNDSIVYRLDNGTRGTEFSEEAKDADDRKPKSYTYPYTHKGGPFHLSLNACIGNSGGSPAIEINHAALTLKREA